jgi:transcriptional regulator with XRE-family HTH domain
MTTMNLDLLKDKMKTYGLKPLAEKAGVSRTSLYNLLNGENFEGETLAKVTQVLNLELEVIGKVPVYENVCNHLAYYGAPLFLNKSTPVTMGLEETTKWGLKYSKEDGLLESVMPFFLMNHFRSLGRAKLLSFLNEESQLQLFGYYLDVAGQYSKNKKMMEFANSFFQNVFDSLYLGNGKPTDRALEVLKLKKNAVAKKWNVLTFSSLDEYFMRFRKWDKVV